jgi:hypothetical protein
MQSACGKSYDEFIINLLMISCKHFSLMFRNFNFSIGENLLSVRISRSCLSWDESKLFFGKQPDVNLFKNIIDIDLEIINRVNKLHELLRVSGM